MPTSISILQLYRHIFLIGPNFNTSSPQISPYVIATPGFSLYDSTFTWMAYAYIIVEDWSIFIGAFYIIF